MKTSKSRGRVSRTTPSSGVLPGSKILERGVWSRKLNKYIFNIKIFAGSILFLAAPCWLWGNDLGLAAVIVLFVQLAMVLITVCLVVQDDDEIDGMVEKAIST